MKRFFLLENNIIIICRYIWANYKMWYNIKEHPKVFFYIIAFWERVMKEENKAKKKSIKNLYITSSVISAVIIYLYYSSRFRSNPNSPFVSFLIIFTPFVYLVISFIAYRRLKISGSNKKDRTLSLIYLPLFIAATNFLITAYTLFYLSDRLIFWSFILLLPLLIVLIFALIVNKLAEKVFPVFVIISYLLSVVFAIYGFLLWFVYVLVTISTI